ncbi:MAG TPA: hypothetical protein VE890_10450 [Thermoguttaceae bacterium]|nr:hypothetical protein [Thermoguttaceae bacterium]
MSDELWACSERFVYAEGLAADFYDFGLEVSALVLGQEQLVIGFVGLTCGDVEETGKFVVRATPSFFPPSS